MEQKVIFNGQVLTLTQFWATGELCLWITDPQQIGMPKMEFVGGYPDEYCIFLKNLTETELAQITSMDDPSIPLRSSHSDDFQLRRLQSSSDCKQVIQLIIRIGINNHVSYLNMLGK